MFLPLLVLEVLGRNLLGGNAAVGTLLGVVFVAFCDLGPSLRIRAWAMSAGAFLGALLMALGALIGGPWWVAAPALGLATFLSGVLLVYGKVVAQVGIILTIAFTLALGKDGGPGVAASRGLGFLFGGTFFLLFVLASSLPGRFLRPAAQGPTAASDALPTAPPAAGTPRPKRSLLVWLAVLRALGAALIAGVAWGTGVPYPQWAPVVVIASVRLDQVAAVNLTIQRIVGTVLGAGLADLVLAWVHNPMALAGLAVGGIFLAFTVKDANNTLFTFFLTILILLLLNILPSGPTYVVLRVVATLIGAMAALGVSWLSAWLVQRASAAVRPPHAATPGGAVD